jgi:hypothetical protein
MKRLQDQILANISAGAFADLTIIEMPEKLQLPRNLRTTFPHLEDPV